MPQEFSSEYLECRGLISTLPPEDHDKVHAAAAEIRAILKRSPAHGIAAMALVGLSVDQDDELMAAAEAFSQRLEDGEQPEARDSL